MPQRIHNILSANVVLQNKEENAKQVIYFATFSGYDMLKCGTPLAFSGYIESYV